MTALARTLAAEPPLDPSGSDARTLLRRELLHPDYHDRNVLQRVLDGLARLLDDAIGSAAGAPALSTFAAIVTFLLLGLVLVWLLSRARRTPQAPGRPGPVVEDAALTAAELRSAAERALAEGRHEAAVVEGFRALTVRQVERGRLDDRPGATAHEVAGDLASTYPDQHGRVAGSASLFDAVRYGDRPATREQAAAVLALDDVLAGRR